MANVKNIVIRWRSQQDWLFDGLPFRRKMKSKTTKGNYELIPKSKLKKPVISEITGF